MRLKDIIGHEEIVKILRGSVITGRVAHAYLFSGPEGVGKLTAALAFAGALMCLRTVEGDACGECEGCRRVAGGIHPDVELLRPEGATIKISQIRQLTASTHRGPATGKWAVRIVEGSDLMTPEAANSLLKTLEDPFPGVIIVLVSHRPQAIIPTVISRCQYMYFQPLLKTNIVKGMIRIAGVSEDDAVLAASLAGGSLGKALDFFSSGLALRDSAFDTIRKLAGASVEEALSLAGRFSDKKEGVIPLLEMMILWFRDMLLYNETSNKRHLINSDREAEIAGLSERYGTGRLLEIINDIEMAKGSLIASANVQLALEVLFLRLAGHGSVFNRPEEVFVI
ncbi:MAG: DNA polymerase III subunit delta' [Bacillota bacterium]